MNDEMFERNLLLYLVHDLEPWEMGVEEKSRQVYMTYRAARCEAQFVAIT